jgi:hypothetical protein
MAVSSNASRLKADDLEHSIAHISAATGMEQQLFDIVRHSSSVCCLTFGGRC